MFLVYLVIGALQMFFDDDDDDDVHLHDAALEVREKQVGLVTFTLAMLYWFVVQESVQLHRLVRRRTVLVLRVLYPHD